MLSEDVRIEQFSMKNSESFIMSEAVRKVPSSNSQMTMHKKKKESDKDAMIFQQMQKNHMI